MADQTPAATTASAAGTVAPTTAAAPSIAARTAAEKKVADAKKALADAETELAKVGGMRETTAAEDAKKPAPVGTTPLVLDGRPGGAFSIDGEGFGPDGVLLVGNRVVPTTSWRDNQIKGQLPADLAAGDIVVKAVGGDRKGVWPTPKLTPAQIAAQQTAQQQEAAKLAAVAQQSVQTK